MKKCLLCVQEKQTKKLLYLTLLFFIFGETLCSMFFLLFNQNFSINNNSSLFLFIFLKFVTDDVIWI
jgi:hypothetical protein